MHRVLLLLSLLAGCGPTRTDLFVEVRGSGKLSRYVGGAAPHDIVAYTPLNDDSSLAAPIGFVLVASDLVLSAPLDAVAAAWTGRPLLGLDGSELSVGSSLTDTGTITEGGVEVGDVALRQVVQAYGRVDASPLGDDDAVTPPFLVLTFDGTTSGAAPDGAAPATYGTQGTLAFVLFKSTYHPCPSFGQICD